MKKILLIFLAAALPIMASAQAMTFDRLQEKYGDRQGYSTIQITEAMLSLITGKKDAPAESVLGAISGITGITILTATHEEADFVADMKKIVAKGSAYKLLASMTGDGQNSMFYYRELPNSARGNEPARIMEFMLLMHGAEDNLVIRVDGDFSIKQISSIVDKAQSGGKIDIGF